MPVPPGMRRKMLAQGVEAVGSSRKEFGEFFKAEMVKWAKVVKAAGIRPD